MELRPYQSKCLAAIDAAYKRGVTRQLVVMATGLGKTVQLAALHAARNHPNLYGLMHRAELLKQAKRSFLEVSPELRIGIEKAGETFALDDQVILASVQTVGRSAGTRLATVAPDWPAIVWTDECISGDAMIATPSGSLRMDKIGVGCDVVCYNGLQCEIRKVLRTFKKGIRRTVQVTTARGRVVRCTPEHRIFTSRGWVAAGDLRIGDEVSVLVGALHPQADQSSGAPIPTYQGIALSNDEATQSGGPCTEHLSMGFHSVPVGVVKGYEATQKAYSNSFLAKVTPDMRSICCNTISVQKLGRWKSRSRSKAQYWEQYLETLPLDSHTPEAKTPASHSITAQSRKSGLCIRRNFYTDYLLRRGSQKMTDMGIVLSWQQHHVSPVSQNYKKSFSLKETGLHERFLTLLGVLGWRGLSEMMGALLTARSTCTQRVIRRKMCASQDVGLLKSMVQRISPQGKQDSFYDFWHPPEKECSPLLNSISHHAWHTNFEPVTSLSDGKDEFVFDIEVEGCHNFFANGVLVHNCHHAAAVSYLNVLNHFGLYGENPSNRKTLSIGTTATPDRLDKMGYDKIFDDVVFRYGLRDGIKDGWLADILAWRIKSGVDLSDVRSHGGDFVESDLDKAVNTPEHNQAVAEVWAERNVGKLWSRSLFFCVTKKHARALASALDRVGAKAAVVVDDTPAEERGSCVAQLKAGALQAIVNVGVFTEGFDLPEIDSIHIVRPTQSRALYVQMLGRGVRKATGKDSMTLYDHTGQSHDVCSIGQIFGLPDAWDLAGQSVLQDAEGLEEVVGDLGISTDGLKSIDDLRTKLQSKAKRMQLIKGSLIAADIASSLVWVQPSQKKEHYIIAWRNETQAQVDRLPMRCQVASFDVMEKQNLFGISERLEIWKNELGKYEAKVWRRKKGTTIEHSMGTDTSLAKLVGRMEKWVHDKRSHKAALLAKSAKWGRDSASNKQIGALRRRGVLKEFLDDSGLTKREASILLGLPQGRINTLFR